MSEINGRAAADTQSTRYIKHYEKPEKISVPQHEEDDYFRPSIDRLRFILMPFLSVLLMGFPTDAGEFLQILCGFVPISFFILSGYLVLRESPDRDKRILRTIKRTAITFIILAVIYFIINFIYYLSLDINMFTAFLSKRVCFNFIVLNIWPFDIGTAIWYVQAQLYAYIFIYILEKLNLLQFDWIIALIFLIPSVLTGELSGVIDFNVFQYTCISGNFFTRAIPYILVGCFMHRRNDIFYRIHRPQYIIGIAVGGALCFAEMFLLNNLGVSGYYGHLLGMPIIAISVCMIALKDKNDFSHTEKRFIPTRTENRIFYYLLQPMGTLISAVLFLICGLSLADEIKSCVSIAAFVLCYAVVLIVKDIKARAEWRKHYKKK